MNYKFTNSLLDDKKYSFYDISKDIYKSPVINRTKPFNNKLINTNYTTNNKFSYTKTSPNNKKISHNRFNYSQFNVSYLTNIFPQKDNVFSENVKNTIERYDFKMNYEILKNKINMLNSLKEKESSKNDKRKNFSPPFRLSNDYDKIKDKTYSVLKSEVKKDKLHLNKVLDKSKVSGAVMSFRKYTDENEHIYSYERSENEYGKKDVLSSSDISDFNFEEITDDFIKIQEDIQKEYQLHQKINKKLMFIDENPGKKLKNLPNIVLSTPVKKGKETCSRNIKKEKDIEEGCKTISLPTSENANLNIRSQNLIRELSNSEYVTLYEREIKAIENKEESLKKVIGLCNAPDETPRQNNLSIELPMKMVMKSYNSEKVQDKAKEEEINFRIQGKNEIEVMQIEKNEKEEKEEKELDRSINDNMKKKEIENNNKEENEIKKKEVEIGIQTDMIVEEKIDEKKNESINQTLNNEQKEILNKANIECEKENISLNLLSPEGKTITIGESIDQVPFNNNLAVSVDKKEIIEESDEELSELSQFLKEAGLLTSTKNIKENVDNKSNELPSVPEEKPVTLNEKIFITQNLNFEIPSKLSLTPTNLKHDLLKTNLTDLQDKPMNITDNISVNEIGNNSCMTNGSKKKVTFSDNKTVISYEAKRFGSICSPSTLYDKRKKDKKPKSILVKKAEEIEGSHDLEKLNDFLFECEDYHYYSKENNSVKAFNLKKADTSNSNAIRVQNNLNNKYINRNKKIVHEIQERLKRGEPKLVLRSPTPKEGTNNPSRNTIRIEALKFDIENLKTEDVFDDTKINKQRLAKSNYDREQIIPENNLHKKSNSSNIAKYSSFTGVNEKKDLSVITDCSHESSSEKNKSNENKNWSNKSTIKVQKI